MITDKLRSYGAAHRQIMPSVEHRSHKGLNNRAENSHVPLRKRERSMQRFRPPGSLQRFVSVFSALRNLFVPPRSQRSALQIHLYRLQAIAEWNSCDGNHGLKSIRKAEFPRHARTAVKVTSPPEGFRSLRLPAQIPTGGMMFKVRSTLPYDFERLLF
jgi:hypothetical protein